MNLVSSTIIALVVIHGCVVTVLLYPVPKPVVLVPTYKDLGRKG